MVPLSIYNGHFFDELGGTEKRQFENSSIIRFEKPRMPLLREYVLGRIASKSAVRTQRKNDRPSELRRTVIFVHGIVPHPYKNLKMLLLLFAVSSTMYYVELYRKGAQDDEIPIHSTDGGTLGHFDPAHPDSLRSRTCSRGDKN